MQGKLPEEVYNKVMADAREYSDQRKLQVAHYDGAANWAPWYVKYAALESEIYGVRAENERLKGWKVKHDDLNERCEKMDVAIGKVIGRIAHINDTITNDVVEILNKAIGDTQHDGIDKEGEV